MILHCCLNLHLPDNKWCGALMYVPFDHLYFFFYSPLIYYSKYFYSSIIYWFTLKMIFFSFQIKCILMHGGTEWVYLQISQIIFVNLCWDDFLGPSCSSFLLLYCQLNVFPKDLEGRPLVNIDLFGFSRVYWWAGIWQLNPQIDVTEKHRSLVLLGLTPCPMDLANMVPWLSQFLQALGFLASMSHKKCFLTRK